MSALALPRKEKYWNASLILNVPWFRSRFDPQNEVMEVEKLSFVS